MRREYDWNPAILIRWGRLGMVWGSLILAAGCATFRLPKEPPVLTPSYAGSPAEQGLLDEYGDRIDEKLGPEESAFWIIDRAELAMTSRLALTDQAVSSLDIQYFIWEADESGRLVAQRVLQAADRGVRVRLLLDDLMLTGREAEIAGLDHHPNIEVRVFNPWRGRNSQLTRGLEFLTRVGLLNHRMHNKIYMADSRFVIIGGRNIGNRYFGLAEDLVQNDLDVMVSGPLVADVADSFDLYWNSDLVYPGALFANGRDPAELYREASTRIEEMVTEHAALLASYPAQPVAWNAQFDEFVDTALIGPGEVHYDSPFVRESEPVQLYQEFADFMLEADDEVLISSPYFIPDADFVASLRRTTDRGVRVVILTNSLASNNNPIAHTGYKPWRKRALEAGVELYEYRADGDAKQFYRMPPAEPDVLGLHSKAAIVDGRRVFISSLNIDPRSIELNTELGMIVEDQALAEALTALIDRDTAPENAWHVTLTDQGRLRWTNSDETVKRQPATGFKQRALAFFYSFLPVKKQL